MAHLAATHERTSDRIFWSKHLFVSCQIFSWQFLAPVPKNEKRKCASNTRSSTTTSTTVVLRLWLLPPSTIASLYPSAKECCWHRTAFQWKNHSAVVGSRLFVEGGGKFGMHTTILLLNHHFYVFADAIYSYAEKKRQVTILKLYYELSNFFVARLVLFPGKFIYTDYMTLG